MKPIDALESAILEFELDFKTPNLDEPNTDGRWFYITLDNLIFFLEDYRKRVSAKIESDELIKFVAEDTERRPHMIRSVEEMQSIAEKCTCAQGEPCNNCKEVFKIKETPEPITKDFLTSYLLEKFETEVRGLYGKPSGMLELSTMFACVEIELKGHKAIEKIGEYCGVSNGVKKTKALTIFLEDVAPAILKLFNS